MRVTHRGASAALSAPYELTVSHLSRDLTLAPPSSSCRNGHFDVALKLVAESASCINLKDRDGKTALSFAEEGQRKLPALRDQFTAMLALLKLMKAV